MPFSLIFIILICWSHNRCQEHKHKEDTIPVLKSAWFRVRALAGMMLYHVLESSFKETAYSPTPFSEPISTSDD